MLAFIGAFIIFTVAYDGVAVRWRSFILACGGDSFMLLITIQLAATNVGKVSFTLRAMPVLPSWHYAGLLASDA